MHDESKQNSYPIVSKLSPIKINNVSVSEKCMLEIFTAFIEDTSFLIVSLYKNRFKLTS